MTGRASLWWQKIKQHPYATGFVILLVLVLILFIFLAYRFGWDWTGFSSGTNQIIITSTPKGNYTATISQSSKSLWDWLQLFGVLAIPAVVGLGAAWYSAQQGKVSDRENTDNQHETALQAYFDKMSELLLKEHLGERTEDGKLKPEYEQVRNIARVRTITVLNQLDARRIGYVFAFLREAGLMSTTSKYFPESNTSKDDVLSLNMADLRAVDWSKANLYAANLSAANLKEANLSEADLTYATLTKTVLHGANLCKSMLSFANLSRASLYKADLSRADLNLADLSGADFWEANFSAAYLHEANLSVIRSVRAILSKADLYGADLSRADLSEADLSGANLGAANLREADLRKVDLREANLRKSMLSRANLSRANLSRANLSEANLILANLSSANLSGANLSGAVLAGANLIEADLSKANLYGVIYNGKPIPVEDEQGNPSTVELTQWPQGFDPKAAGAICEDS